MNTNNDEMTTNNSDKYFEKINKLDSIKNHTNLDPYDTLCPLWSERKNYSEVEIKLMIAMHEIHQNHKADLDRLYEIINVQQRKINELCDRMSK